MQQPKHQLQSGGLWLATVSLALGSAIATPSVPDVERHAHLHPGTPLSFRPVHTVPLQVRYWQ